MPSPHQTFTRLEYGTRLPLAVPYGHGPLHVYPQGMRGRRRDVDPSAALRSPLLDDFRSNKSRKWELRVSNLCRQQHNVAYSLLGYIRLHRGI